MQTRRAMRLPSRVIVWLTALLGLASVAAARPVSEGGPVQLRFKHGDDPRWSAPGWDDRDWPVIGPGDFPARAGVTWLRFRMAPGCTDAVGNLGRGYSYAWPKNAGIDGIFLGAIFSFELYWDGQLLERSGVVGASRDEEVAGPLDHVVRIPDALLGPGEHVVAIRMSNHHYNFREAAYFPGFRLVNFAERLAMESRRPLFPLMGLAGALVMTAVASVLLPFVERRRTLLLCHGLSLLLAVFYGLIALRWLVDAPYDWHAPRLAAVVCTMVAIGVLLPWILLEQFAVPRRGWWLAALVAVLAGVWRFAPYYEEEKALWLCRVMLVGSTAVAGWAVWHRRTGARVVFATMLAGLGVMQSSPRLFLDPTFFLVFGGLVLAIFAALGAQVREDRRRAREAMQAAARLELELLKKNIQPHFLVNTLATIQETIEQEPQAAVAMIGALAGEFRILSRVSGEKLIPLGDELELCRQHLAVMSRRKGARCTLLVRDVDERTPVPPALFHTLIENGLTHLLPVDGEQRFALEGTPPGAETRYVLSARGRPVAPAGGNPSREGTGLRYLRARLEESFPGRWSLQGEPTGGGWRTTVTWGKPVQGEERP